MKLQSIDTIFKNWMTPTFVGEIDEEAADHKARIWRDINSSMS